MRQATQRHNYEDTAEYARSMQEAVAKAYEQLLKRVARCKIQVDP